MSEEKQGMGRYTREDRDALLEQRYVEIKEDMEHNWPQWKLDYYNNHIAVSPYAEKIYHK